MVSSEAVTDSPGVGVPRSRKGIRHLRIFLLTVVPVLALLITMFLPKDASYAAEITSEPPAGSAWLGGVQYAHEFHKWQTAWDFFHAGQPTVNGYRQLSRECDAMDGTHITKAGSGSISGRGKGYTMVTFDYSCWGSADE